MEPKIGNVTSVVREIIWQKIAGSGEVVRPLHLTKGMVEVEEAEAEATMVAVVSEE